MNDTLSVILPVRNAEATLAGQIGRLLDTLPDLSPRFEVIVVDDGSSDHTADLAEDLAREYPQIKLARHAKALGIVPAIETGKRLATGRTLVAQAPDFAAINAAVRQQREPRREPNVPEQVAGKLDAQTLERLMKWGQSLEAVDRLPPRTDPPHGRPQKTKSRVASFLKHLQDLALGE